MDTIVIALMVMLVRELDGYMAVDDTWMKTLETRRMLEDQGLN